MNPMVQKIRSMCAMVPTPYTIRISDKCHTTIIQFIGSYLDLLTVESVLETVPPNHTHLYLQIPGSHTQWHKDAVLCLYTWLYKRMNLEEVRIDYIRIDVTTENMSMLYRNLFGTLMRCAAVVRFIKWKWMFPLTQCFTYTFQTRSETCFLLRPTSLYFVNCVFHPHSILLLEICFRHCRNMTRFHLEHCSFVNVEEQTIEFEKWLKVVLRICEKRGWIKSRVICRKQQGSLIWEKEIKK
jgi:hypothetical protein